MKPAMRSSTLSNLLCIGTLALLLSACGGNAAQPAAAAQPLADDTVATVALPATAPPDAATLARLRQACQTFFDTMLLPNHFNGGMIVAKNGHIVFERYSGTGFVNGFDTVTANTPFHIASVSKTFTAMAVLRLWEQGKLNIDDEVNKYLPGFNYPGVTVRTLLNHRSGLPNYMHFLEPMGWDNTKHISNEGVLQFMVDRKAEMVDVAPPNTRFSYNNTNYALLALIIEKASGKKYAQYLQQQFFKPLQMHNSYVFKLADTLTATTSFDWKGRLIPFNFLDSVYGDKNIYSTVSDLLQWDRALNSGLLFKPETLAQAYAPYSNERPGIKNYGLGWRMNNYPNGKKIIFHNGWWHGNNAVFIRLLQDSATIILLGNRFCRATYKAIQLANLFGDYGLPEEEEEGENNKTDSLTLPLPRRDSLQLLPKKKMNKKDSALQELFKDKHKAAFEEQARRMKNVE
jgi:CubicO group peptidase (beta-lactamase class C family)